MIAALHHGPALGLAIFLLLIAALVVTAAVNCRRWNRENPPCPACGGEGEIFSNYTPGYERCPVCEGTGTMPAPPETEAPSEHAKEAEKNSTQHDERAADASSDAVKSAQSAPAGLQQPGRDSGTSQPSTLNSQLPR